MVVEIGLKAALNVVQAVFDIISMKERGADDTANLLRVAFCRTESDCILLLA